MKQTIKKEWEGEFDKECLKLSYKHNNEITLAIDDLHKLFSALLKQQKQELKEKMSRFITTNCPKCKKVITIEL